MRERKWDDFTALFGGKIPKQGPEPNAAHNVEGEERKARSPCRWPGTLPGGEIERGADMGNTDTAQWTTTRLWFGVGAGRAACGSAREAAMTSRRQVRDGFDPIADRWKVCRIIPNFETVTRTCHETLGEGWNSGHHARWLSGFELHIFPRIGTKPVDQLDSACVVAALSPIWREIDDVRRTDRVSAE